MAKSTGDKSLLQRIGCAVSDRVADVAAHPFAQIGIILFCALWWTVGLPTDILTAALSILAITLTQMVLNHQNEREADDHRRDVAMHAKLDELVIASKTARNEMAGIEEMTEADIEELKKDVRETLEQSGVASSGEVVRVADQTVETVARVKKARTKAKAAA